MSKEPKPRRGMPRSLIYAMIPGGFLLLILILFLAGFWTQEESDVPQPPPAQAPAAAPAQAPTLAPTQPEQAPTQAPVEVD